MSQGIAGEPTTVTDDAPPVQLPAVRAALQREANATLYRVGTLTYTKVGLFFLFAWLLWGDVCYYLMESVPGLVPLRLHDLGASDSLVALINGTLPFLLNATVCPWVSFKSDRHRGRLGRRLPFILYTAPFLTVCLVLIGFSGSICAWLHPALTHAGLGMSLNSFTIAFIAVFQVSFAFFNMFIGSVFWYLFNDVVPEKVLSRFLSAMRIVSSLATSFYSFFILPQGLTHMPWVFMGIALLYFVSFTLICFRVREGEYPPPPPKAEAAGMLSGVRTYVRECYSIGFYWYYFLFVGFMAMSTSIGLFGMLFARHMGLDLDQLGKIGGIAGLVALPLLYVFGIMADRVHPMRTMVFSQLLTTLYAPITIIWLFIPHPSTAFVFYFSLAMSLVFIPISALFGVSALPNEMRLYPKQSFGQFCSAAALVRSVGALIGGQLAGGFLDLMRWIHGGSDFAYRYIPVWQTFFQICAFICVCLLYRAWKKRGGDEGYKPPVADPQPAETSVPALV